MKKQVIFGLIVISLFLSPLDKSAQSAEKKATIKGNPENFPVGTTNVDLAVPRSPAFTVLGVTPETVIRPTSPREFATALLNGVDPNGNFQSGIAIDTAPYLLFKGNELSLKEYQTNNVKRFLARTQLSFATTKGSSGDDKSTKLALGFRFTPFDLGDPRMDLEEGGVLQCLAAKMELPKPKLRGIIQPMRVKLKKLINSNGDKEIIAKLDKEIKEIEAQLNDEKVNKKIADECRKKGAQKNWNSSSLSFGAAPTWLSPKGNSDDFEWSGAALWGSLALRMGGSGHLIFHGRYRMEELFPDPEVKDKFSEQDTLLLASQVRMSGPRIDLGAFKGKTPGVDYNFVLDVGYMKEDGKDRRDDELVRYSAGIEVKMKRDLYLKISAGGESGRKVEGDQGFMMGEIKWGFSSDPTTK